MEASTALRATDSATAEETMPRAQSAREPEAIEEASSLKECLTFVLGVVETVKFKQGNAFWSRVAQRATTQLHMFTILNPWAQCAEHAG